VLQRRTAALLHNLAQSGLFQAQFFSNYRLFAFSSQYGFVLEESVFYSLYTCSVGVTVKPLSLAGG
jgi:hypothetical protein